MTNPLDFDDQRTVRLPHRSTTPGVLAGLVAALALTACETPKGPGGGALTTISTTPAGARIVVEGFGECESPCTIEHDAPRKLSIAKTGFVPRTIEIRPGDRQITITLELAAPTKDIDAESLPDL